MANSREVKTITNEKGCHLVVSHKLNHDGYFRKIDKHGKLHMYHRLVYQEHYGEIPEGYEVDHICRNRHCINPKHLQLLTIAEHKAKTNTERSDDKRIPAKEYWLETGCTGTHLAEKFGVSFGTGCKWIRNWRKQC